MSNRVRFRPPPPSPPAPRRIKLRIKPVEKAPEGNGKPAVAKRQFTARTPSGQKLTPPGKASVGNSPRPPESTNPQKLGTRKLTSPERPRGQTGGAPASATTAPKANTAKSTKADRTEPSSASS